LSHVTILTVHGDILYQPHLADSLVVPLSCRHLAVDKLRLQTVPSAGHCIQCHTPIFGLVYSNLSTLLVRTGCWRHIFLLTHGLALRRTPFRTARRRAQRAPSSPTFVQQQGFYLGFGFYSAMHGTLLCDSITPSRRDATSCCLLTLPRTPLDVSLAVGSFRPLHQRRNALLTPRFASSCGIHSLDDAYSAFLPSTTGRHTCTAPRITHHPIKPPCAPPLRNAYISLCQATITLPFNLYRAAHFAGMACALPQRNCALVRALLPLPP